MPTPILVIGKPQSDRFSGSDVPGGHLGAVDNPARCSSLESEQRELSNAWNPRDDLTQRKSSKVVNQGPPFFSVAYRVLYQESQPTQSTIQPTLKY
jgi:hypothetical protein